MRNLDRVDIQRFCVTGSSDSWLESAGNRAATMESRDFRNRAWFARQATQAGEGGNPAPRHRGFAPKVRLLCDFWNSRACCSKSLSKSSWRIAQREDLPAVGQDEITGNY